MESFITPIYTFFGAVPPWVLYIWFDVQLYAIILQPVGQSQYLIVLTWNQYYSDINILIFISMEMYLRAGKRYNKPTLKE